MATRAVAMLFQCRETDRTTTMILIVTASDDEPADEVERILRERGATTFRFDPAEFPSTACLTAEFTTGQAPVCTLRSGSQVLTFQDVTAIWYRRPGRPEASPGTNRTPAVHKAITDHCRDFLAAFWDIFDCYWMPGSPSALKAAQVKGPQLRRARELGFEIPPTLLTNDPQEFLAFYRAHDGQLISKLASAMYFPAAEGEEFSRFTEVVTPRDVGYAQDIAQCPIILQAYVPKQVEIRTTVVGSQVFAAEIRSQEANRGRHDWRRYDFASTPYLPHMLPPEVAARCVALVQSYGLTFGTIDLILTPDGRYVFLELNPNGEFAWIEALTELPISAAIAELLLAPSRTAMEVHHGR